MMTACIHSLRDQFEQAFWMSFYTVIFNSFLLCQALMFLPGMRFRFHQNEVILSVAIPPTNAEAADLADRFRIPARDKFKTLGLVILW